MKRLVLVGVWLVFSLFLMGSLPTEAARIKTFVSIVPQKYFVERIGGDLVEVFVLVPPAADPHTYEPKPGQMAELARAAVYFAVGVDFEKAWLRRISAVNPAMRIVRTDEGIEKIPLVAHHHHEEKGQANQRDPKAQGRGQLKEPSAGHSGAPDPHVWLSPPLVRIQAKHIAEALAEIDSVNRAHYEENLAAFLRELDAVDMELKSLFARNRGARFMVFHPSWGYFAKAYGLEQVPIEMEGKDPKPAQIKELIHHAREQSIRVVFVQPQFSRKSAEMVAREIGGEVVAVDPLHADWAQNLREVARRFKAAFP